MDAAIEEVEVEEVVEEQQSLTDALTAEFEKQAASDAPSEEDVAETVEAEPTEEVVDEVTPPEHWSDEDKQAFVTMDESGREWALRLEANAHKGIEEKSLELKQFRDAFEPYKHLVPPGVSEAQVIQNLLNAQAVLQRSPVEGIKWLMRSYGVDEKQFNPTDTVPDDDVYVDPEVRNLTQKVNQLTERAQNDLQRAEQERQQQVYAEIVKFRDTTDDDGNVLYPHFAQVQGVMAGLMQSGRAIDMESAYAEAVWAIPEYRDVVIAKQTKELAEKEMAASSVAAKKAIKAATSVSGKSSSKKSTGPRTVADSLAENYDKSIRGEL